MRIEGWTFGGGTVLMRRYVHRVSNDIDIFLPDPQYLGHLSPRLNATVESLTSSYVEQAGFLKLRFPEGEIDFIVAAPLTANPARTERILERDMSVETTAEILAKKIWHRAAVFSARDILDFAVIAEREPGVLDQISGILAARYAMLLARFDEREQTLREQFAALDTIGVQPGYDECVEEIASALARASRATPPRVAQRGAGYCVTGSPHSRGGHDIRAMRLQSLATA